MCLVDAFADEACLYSLHSPELHFQAPLSSWSTRVACDL